MLLTSLFKKPTISQIQSKQHLEENLNDHAENSDKEPLISSEEDTPELSQDSHSVDDLIKILGPSNLLEENEAPQLIPPKKNDLIVQFSHQRDLSSQLTMRRQCSLENMEREIPFSALKAYW